ncbi:hypothetical protein [Intrasporangium mesophilum]
MTGHHVTVTSGVNPGHLIPRETITVVTSPIARPKSGLARRAASKLVELVGEFVAEVLVAGLACLLAGLVIAAAIWGWNRHPGATVAAGAAGTLVLGYGAWSLWTEHARGKGSHRPLASMAIALFLIVGVWLLYVVTYCSCA